MNNFKRCSYTISESPLEDKWGVLAKAWENKIVSNTKRPLRLKTKNKWKDKV
jgi:hypothetical protein